MTKHILRIVLGVLVISLTAPAGLHAEKALQFNPEAPEMRDIKTVNKVLESFIAKHDRDAVKKVMAYTQARTSTYALLTMVEFYEHLSMDKLETMRQQSPERWQLFQTYINKALAWLSITKKADDFLGDHLDTTLKKELGEDSK